MLYQNVLEIVGNTPMVKINKINKNKKVNIYIKLEGQNPGGSIKDRIALAMIVDAEKSGELTKDKIILEPTSGNTGIGLAMIAAFKGHRITLIMSESMSEERRKILKAYGAKLVLTPREGGTDGAIRKAHEMIGKYPKKYWMPNQYDNSINPKTHYDTTAEEILHDVPDISHFVATMGTSGTIMGIGKKLKEKKKDVQIIAVEPLLGHKLQGLKNMEESIVPKIYNQKMFNKKVNINDEDVFAVVRKIAKEEGLFLGMSSGASLFVALELAKKLKKGNIVIISPDRGEKYTSTTLFN